MYLGGKCNNIVLFIDSWCLRICPYKPEVTPFSRAVEKTCEKIVRLIGEKAKDLIKTLSEDIINKYNHITYYYQHSYPTKSGVCL